MMVSQPRRKIDSVQLTRHVHIGADKADTRILFQYNQRARNITCRNDFEASFFKNFGCIEPDQKIVIND